jgi:hypothetical protein
MWIMTKVIVLCGTSLAAFHLSCLREEENGFIWWCCWSEMVSKWVLNHIKSERIRHPKEGRFNSHRVNPRFPLSAPWGGPLLLMSFGFNIARGIIKRSALGEYSKRTLEWKLRMIYRFSSLIQKRQVTHLFMIDAPGFRSYWSVKIIHY